MTVYTVQSGDTLGAIAQKFLGKASLYMVIAEANNIEDPNKISVGMELTIPGTEDESCEEEACAEEQSCEEEKPGEEEAPSAGGEGGLTAQSLERILGGGSDERVEAYLDAINECFDKYEINTPLRMAHFLSQVCHESNNFRAIKENLNYSAAALQAVFGKYFDADSAQEYARQPEKIANRVYANRMDNGDEASGDGWRYRGRGLIQLTGKHNYTSFSEAYGVDVVASPEEVAEDPKLCVAAAGWYWTSRNINKAADADDVEKVTRLINGGLHGLEDRTEKLEKIKTILS